MSDNKKTTVIKSTPNYAAFQNGLASVLPKGIVMSPEKMAVHDYTVTDPMNMRAVDTVLYQTAMDAHRAMDPRGKLYVVMSELHTKSAQIMSQTGLIENLAIVSKQGIGNVPLKVILALETPYDQLAENAKLDYGLNITDDIHLDFIQRDSMGHIFSRAVLANNTYTQATQSMNHLLETVLRTNTPLALIDAGNITHMPSGNKFNYLDETDSIASDVALAYGVDLTKQFVPSSPYHDNIKGPQIRNEVMAIRTVNEAKKHEANIIVSAVGLSHMGDKRSGLAFEESYQAKLASKIGEHDQILTVIFTKSYSDRAEINAKLSSNHPQITPIILRNLSSKGYVRDSDGEKDFISKLGNSYRRGLIAKLFSQGEIPARFGESPPRDPEDMYTELQTMLDQFTP